LGSLRSLRKKEKEEEEQPYPNAFYGSEATFEGLIDYCLHDAIMAKTAAKMLQDLDDEMGL
jgi:hypothetical protein